MLQALTEPSPDETFTEQQIEDSVAAIERGDLVLLKGDIGYGLFSASERGLRKMYAAKGRPYGNPCIVVATLDILDDIALVHDARIGQWIAQMAVRTTLAVVLPVRPDSRLLSALPPWVYGQTVTNGSVAAFLNPGTFLERVIGRAARKGLPLVGSSANPSAQGNIYDYSELPASIADAAEFSIPHGRSKHANPRRLATTMVNFTNWTVKRRGVNAEMIVPSFLQLQEICKNV
jgi:tRNA A37 threonylcarbamoyladenosine synthetase subunit TsaC/SUA5/YrdC